MNKEFKKVQEVNLVDDASSERLIVKGLEEFGEFAQAINWLTGYKKTNKSKEEILDEIAEEGVDTIICVLAAMDKAGVEYDRIKKFFPIKIKKWRNKFE